MTTNEVAQILAAVARVEVEVKNLAEGDKRASDQIEKHSLRLDKLERLAYTALGIAVASGASQFAPFLR